ncbi:SAGA-associated factor 11 homolog [Harmonia axyridis]|uniref:SAGA-associated factor 11 homolog n=1 Tax=Harmonia axyridis TaxID=115357 RepID=UPI001E27968C|nr:SAGA-associated factor 11 homolog [Harmonia axyridis]
MAGRCPEDMNDELFSKLSRDLHDIVSNPQLLRTSTERFFNNLVDELTLGIIFDTHRKAKTRAFDFDDEGDGIEIERGEDIETFSQYNIKKTQDCVCPYCDRAVAATRFATHLERCMVEGKNRQKNAARKAAAKQEQENDYRDNGMSEDYDNTDDDADWSPGDKRRKKKKEKNGRKRAKATPKKNAENDYMDSLNLEAEADEQDLSNLRDLLQDRSNCSSPADSTCSSRSGSSGGRKREKSRTKRRRERASPCSSNSMLD